MQKRFVQLTEAEIATLREGKKHHSARVFRERCHCLLLSHDGYEVKQLAAVFEVSTITIYGWLNRWQADGFVGLRDKAGRGRKAILSVRDLPQVKARVQASAQQLRLARAELKADLAREFSEKTLRRFLKNLTADISGGVNA